MALKLGTGAEAYAPLAMAIIGGLSFSVVLTVFLVPAACLMVYRRREKKERDRDIPRVPPAASAPPMETQAEPEPVS